MNLFNDFPVSSKIKVMLGKNKAYEGIVSNHPSKNDSPPVIVIEQCNRQQVAFMFLEKFNGEKGWVQIPYPLKKEHATNEDAMLYTLEKIN